MKLKALVLPSIDITRISGVRVDFILGDCEGGELLDRAIGVSSNK